MRSDRQLRAALLVKAGQMWEEGWRLLSTALVLRMLLARKSVML